MTRPSQQPKRKKTHHLGLMLRFYRFHREINVRNFAQQVGISAATISRVERGGDYDVTTLLKLVDWMRKHG